MEEEILMRRTVLVLGAATLGFVVVCGLLRVIRANADPIEWDVTITDSSHF